MIQPTVEWQVVGACNYACTYCIQSPAYRRGRPADAQLDAAVRFFRTLPGAWELKCSGGEAFAHPAFLARVVPALMDDTPHAISVLTNFSADDDELAAFATRTRGRLRVFSASLHLEHADPAAFVAKARRFVAMVDPDVRFVVNQVVLPDRLDEAARCRDLVLAAGLRWFPQLYKVKHQGGADPFRVADYPDAAALAALIGDAPGPGEANVAPSYRGRVCRAGVDYLVLDTAGEVWRCRSDKRNRAPSLGNAFTGTATLAAAPRRCPWALCPCTVPANRGMIEGVGAHA